MRVVCFSERQLRITLNLNAIALNLEAKVNKLFGTQTPMADRQLQISDNGDMGVQN